MILKQTKKLTLAAMFFAIGLILPLFIAQIPTIGQMLLPMHIPVLLCGLMVGWEYGLIVGFFLPLVRSILFGMPAMFPNAVSMAFELATYGLVIGWLYGHAKWQCVKSLYRCMISAMLAGRLVWGVVRIVLLGMSGVPFGWQLFLAGAFFNAIPGIILQLIMIPALMVALNKAKIVPFRKNSVHQAVTESEN
ncbi:ECF transporter S component [Clostridiaceae bacterium Marseille-Q4145]|nr:ECF transporter S component [Clostridiaceae bacterium Marseille-Q4145]